MAAGNHNLPRISPRTVRLVPLGGLGEIGMNMLVLETDEDVIVIDAGIMFPEPYMLGVDLVIPDTTWLLERRDRVRAIFLTHGHEDHIGGLPFLLPDLTVPVYGTLLTLGLVKEKLAEFSFPRPPELRPVAPGDVIHAGDFTVDFIRVQHSIPDGVALRLKTPAGTILHTGDFKLDTAAPADGGTDLEAFARCGREGVDLMLSDSTNVERGGFSESEHRVREELERLIAAAPGRVIVSLFSSNLHRIQELVHIAGRQQRHVAFFGRSMHTNTTVARQLGFMEIPPGRLVDIQDIDQFEPRQILIVTTGSQGEPLSGLSLMAGGANRWLRAWPDDTVILSSRFIPGNEKAITTLINRLCRRGVRVLYQPLAFTHTSGHAHRDELRLMMNLVQPAGFMPVHGEYRHLVQHAELARENGIAAESVVVAVDGDVITLREGAIALTDTIETGKILIDGKSTGDLNDVILHDRRHLSRDGMAVIVVAVNESTGEVIYGPDITTRGLVFADEQETMLADVHALVVKAIDEIRPAERTNWAELKTVIRTAAKRYFKRELQRRPIILPVIIEL
ncbi:MAG: ribonuclease J [Deltaproteobacteria bacterium]|nr:ribonuclease J [Candidatus Anaeroferrophillacea bacterium]